MNTRSSRRTFLKSSLAAAAAGAGLSRFAFGDDPSPGAKAAPQKIPATADSMILIYLPGGVAQTDMWDPKTHTPFVKDMKGSEMLGTCPSIPTSADGIRFGEGLENIASVMNKGALLRTLSNETKFGAVHLKAQYYLMTGYLFPAGVKAPSIGAMVGRSTGRRNEHIPPYIYIGRDIDTSDSEKLFISEYLSPGFYGVNHAPFMIPDPAQGLSTLGVAAGMSRERLDRRLDYLKRLAAFNGKEFNESEKAAGYMKVMEDARAMMDSPVKKAFDFARDEKPETLQAYEPEIAKEKLLDKSYYYGNRFGNSLLLARRLVESGSRFVQVEYQYGPFKGFDMHENGYLRIAEMKRQVDRPIAQLIKDLDQRGLLERTLVCVMTEFGRTIASAPAAGSEPDGFAERHTGEKLILQNEKMYGFHGHFSSCNCVLFFGGGIKKGFAYGKTAENHPMLPVENPVNLSDVHATIFKAMGLPPDMNFVTEGRPFYLTKDGKGKAIDALLA